MSGAWLSVVIGMGLGCVNILFGPVRVGAWGRLERSALHGLTHRKEIRIYVY